MNYVSMSNPLISKMVDQAGLGLDVYLCHMGGGNMYISKTQPVLEDEDYPSTDEFVLMGQYDKSELFSNLCHDPSLVQVYKVLDVEERDTEEQLIDAVKVLQGVTNPAHEGQLRVVQTGSTTYLEIFGTNVWDSDYDHRRTVDNKYEVFEPFEDFIKREVSEIIQAWEEIL